MGNASHFVAAALDLRHAPPIPKDGARYAGAEACWLCGGATGGVGWPLASALASTFTGHPAAACPDSDAMCQPCVAITDSAVFKALVVGRGLDIKLWAQCGWHNYSHFVTDAGGYEAPTPARVREILLDPPPGRFVLAINLSGQKHSLIHGHVASGVSATVPLVFDDTLVWLRIDDFRACLAALEDMAQLGIAKEQLRSGVYHQESIRRAGLAAWRAGEALIRSWRDSAPKLLDLAAWCGRGPKWFETREVRP